MTTAAPLMIDPIFDGVTDPSLVRNELTGEWWCIFAHRRANVRLSTMPNIARCHGTPLGAASSPDGGRSWLYRGTVDLPIEPGHNTLWGPHVVRADDRYHLFTTFIRGVPADPAWDTHGRPSAWPREIHHLVSDDLWTWVHLGRLDLSTQHAVDPCVLPGPDGDWSLWFKDEADGGSIKRVTSADLNEWSSPTVVLDEWHESPVAFSLGGYYWLVAESRSGLTSYRSPDALTWTPTGAFVAGSGSRPSDAGPPRSPCVVPTCSDTAAFVYYVQTGVDSFDERVATSSQSSVMQAAGLSVRDGRLVCDRDAPLDLALPVRPVHPSAQGASA